MCLTAPRFPKRKVTWVVDFGATIHCVNDLSCFTRIYENHQPVRIKVANNETLTANVVGECEVSLRDTTGRNHTITLHNVVYHKAFAQNLMSVRKLWRHNRVSTKFCEKSHMKCTHSGAVFPTSPITAKVDTRHTPHMPRR